MKWSGFDPLLLSLLDYKNDLLKMRFEFLMEELDTS
jgi:hypothetical protein